MTTPGWYIKTGSKIQGPFSDAKVKEYEQAGRLKPGMMMSRDMLSWIEFQPAGIERTLVTEGSDLQALARSRAANAAPVSHETWYVRANGKEQGPFRRSSLD